MKKFVWLLPVLFLLAAGCEKEPMNKTGDVDVTPAPLTSNADAVVNDLLSDIDAEEFASMQSDTAIVSSDSDVIINTAGGVSNAN